MSYLKIASKVIDRKAGEFTRDRDSFVSGLNEHERIAYGELAGIMTDKERWNTPETKCYLLTHEQAHREAMGIIQRYRNNQRERELHAKTK